MQKELAGMNLAKTVRITGINQWDRGSANDAMCMGRDLPWLQDTETMKVWDLWEHEYRDVLILNEKNELVGKYNLTNNDLGMPDNYNALRDMILNAANQ